MDLTRVFQEDGFQEYGSQMYDNTKLTYFLI